VRRLGLLAAVVTLVAVVLVMVGVVSIRLELDRPTRLEAPPFWQERHDVGAIPSEMGIWVEVARNVQPAVVNVSTTQRTRSPLGEEFFRRFFEGGGPPPRQATSLGSGLVASADGYVVTNYHVVSQAAEILVRLADHRELRARLVGSDPKTDLALLKIDASGLPVIPFGDSDRLQVGEPVMAIGNPFGLEQTVTTGIVSAKERFIGSGPYDDFIQTDASINPGNSGGPLVDARGRLVGINSAIFSQGGGWSGIGFAIPVNLAKQVLPQLRASGKVTRGYLGVSVAPVSSELATRARLPARRGALVAEVVAGSPAAQAGLRPGDIITAFEGNPVQDPLDLTRRVAGTPPGTTVTVQVARDGAHTLKVTLAELKDRPPAPR
jgi:serine protease Do